MKNRFNTQAIVLMLIINIGTAQAQKYNLLKPNCANTISCASNQYGINQQTLALAKAPKNQFSIIVNPQFKPVNFISVSENYYLSQSQRVDTSIFSLIKPEWKQASAAQKAVIIAQEKANFATLAKKYHAASNAGQQLIYMVNNTPNDVALQMQDWSFIGILEALIGQNQWRAVQYWQFSTCGNSYLLKHIAPGNSLSFIAPVSMGNYKTTLRYKILGKNIFYYSNSSGLTHKNS
ncbi:hypothetical protein BDD43_5032 [Mucilaginibacter gracilis]|uniref:Uncharacterized protein n=1 Tax=Mucilaginibacter gracilis TaxID=423350 RepID=A0A495J9P1_9SPHI|nr:hypothetical protein [Mucilaginibacter gracilis]RKR84779.1 hypothetical protein BDD43_5032 [Mucilaginibacter gracilis]